MNIMSICFLIGVPVVSILYLLGWIGKVAKEDLDEKGLRRGRAWDKTWDDEGKK